MRPQGDIVPFYFPLVPARAPSHGLDELLWALKLRQMRPLCVPEVKDPMWDKLRNFVGRIDTETFEVPIQSFEEYLETVS